MRNKNTENFIADLSLRAESIADRFTDFSDGCRVLLLLHRKKDGGGNKEEARASCSRVTFNKEQYATAVKELVIMKEILYPQARLYASVNPRSIKKTVRYTESRLLDVHYSDDEQRDFTHKKLLRSPRHFLMQQNNAETNLFILDIDNEECKDIMGEVLKDIAKNDIEIVLQYQTKNGWHIVTKPFNPSLIDYVDIKKDGLILLDY